MKRLEEQTSQVIEEDVNKHRKFFSIGVLFEQKEKLENQINKLDTDDTYLLWT